MRIRCMVVVPALTLVACGSDSHGVSDASSADAVTIDARVPDAPPDAPDAIVGRYVLDSVVAPTTVNESNMLGMDIDSGEPSGDVGVDNQLGNILAAVQGQGFNIQMGVTFAVDHGQSITLFDFRADRTLHTYAGTDPIPAACANASDTICRLHFQGTGSFDQVPGSPTGTMPTMLNGLQTVAGPGSAVVQITLLGTPQPLNLELMAARFVGLVEMASVRTAKLAGAVSAQQIDADVIPALAAAFRAQVAIDCIGSPPPGCGCVSGSNGATLINLFDPDDDCVISDAEVRNDSLIVALFAPDVNIGGVDALSIGVGVTAVPATFRFTPP